MPLNIERLSAYQILDSRGRPTVAARVSLSNGVTATGHAPSGASTGKHEGLELRDGDPELYAGQGVLRAVRNVEQFIFPAVRGLEAEQMHEVDARMIELDVLLARSPPTAQMQCSRFRALWCARCPCLERTLVETLGSARATIPVPMVNILSGGLHAAHNIEFQDFLVIANGFYTYSEALHAVTRVHRRPGSPGSAWILRYRGRR